MSIRAINGYKIRKNEKERTTTIEYHIDGQFFTQSIYYWLISDENVEKIERKLTEYVTINKNAEELCQTMHLPTIVNEVERIIFDD